MTDYQTAKKLKLTQLNRWGGDMNHHPKSIQLLNFIAEHDANDYGGFFSWEAGGDGDNGETLMYQMDAFFEMENVRKVINDE